MAEERKKYVPVYCESAEHAFSKGPQSPEAVAFRNSYNATEKCLNDLENSLYKMDFEGAKGHSSADELIDRHGIERVKYVLATFVRSSERAGEFSESVKAWAEGIRISSDPRVTGAVRFDREIPVKDMETLIKTIVQKDTERCAAPQENNEDKEGKMDSSNGNGKVTKNGDGSLCVTMPEKAVIRRYASAAALCMPRGHGYDLYRYIVDMKDLKDTGDGTVTVRLADPEYGPVLKDIKSNCLTVKRRGEEKRIYAEELEKIFSEAKDEDYTPKMYDVEIPKQAVRGNFPNMARITFPEGSTYARQHAVIPLAYRDKEKSTEGKYVFSVPDYMNFSLRDGVGDRFISAEELQKEFTGEDIKKRAKWTELTLNHEAFLHTYDKTTLFKMPATGEYKGYAYYMPNGMIVNPEAIMTGGDFKLRIPETKTVEIKNCYTGDKKTLKFSEYVSSVTGKEASDYDFKARKTVPREASENKTKKTGPDEGSGK
ncbi:MAG: DUF3849 domain-containing protein [Bacteroidales bacterium]|nr:DUF3849 domain-containing protein [Bacteroidales bacterium]